MESCCFFKRPYSSWHGHSATIVYVPHYGIIAGDWVTSNGCSSMVRQCIDEPTDLKLFDEFIKLIVVGI
jgi:hypothetical protein